MKQVLNAVVVGLGLALGGQAALADKYPSKPVNMVIPYGPGGATDVSARNLAAPLGKQFNQPLLMVNRAGAGGVPGALSVAQAKPDGYSILFARVGTHSVNPALKEAIPYKLADFDYIGVYEINPVACVVRPDSGFDNIQQVADAVKKNPGKITFSSSGVGSMPMLASILVLNEFGIEEPTKQATHIPMKSDGEGATAVLNGTATMFCGNTSGFAGFVKNKQLKAILVTTAEPVVGFDAPNATDLKKPNLTKLVGWTGLAGPKGMPKEAVAMWRDALGKAVQDKAFVTKMESLGSVIKMMGPEESEAFIKGQYESFRAIVDKLGIRIKG